MTRRALAHPTPVGPGAMKAARAASGHAHASAVAGNAGGRRVQELHSEPTGAPAKTHDVEHFLNGKMQVPGGCRNRRKSRDKAAAKGLTTRLVGFLLIL